LSILRINHHPDHLSGASIDTTETGAITQTTDYHPYGSLRTEEHTGEYSNDYLFTGKELDRETELYCYEARYYDPLLGRFTSLDPWFGDITDPQSLNKYSYVRNNPLKYVDPTGEKTEVWIKHGMQGNVFDFGHAMIRIYHGDYDQVFDYYEDGNGDEHLSMDTIEGQMNYYSRDDGATFTVFELDVHIRDEFSIKEHLEYWNEHESNLPEYNTCSNNCSDYLADEILKNFLDLDLESFAGFTPEDLAKELFTNPKVKEIYGGYEKNKEFHRIEYDKESDSSNFNRTLRFKRDAGYGKRSSNSKNDEK